MKASHDHSSRGKMLTCSRPAAVAIANRINKPFVTILSLPVAPDANMPRSGVAPFSHAAVLEASQGPSVGNQWILVWQAVFQQVSGRAQSGASIAGSIFPLQVLAYFGFIQPDRFQPALCKERRLVGIVR